MTASELKLKIFREIDTLDQSTLNDFYGVLVNFLNSQNKEEDWQKLTNEQRQGILSAIEDVKAGNGIPHGDIVSKYRRKYSNA